MAARALRLDWPPMTVPPATNTITVSSVRDRPGWPIIAMLRQAIANATVSTGMNPPRSTNQTMTNAEIVPPTWSIVPTITAVDVEYPAPVTTVGSQLDSEYRLKRFMKLTIH